MQEKLLEKSQIQQTKIKKDVSTLFQIKSTAGSKDELYPQSIFTFIGKLNQSILQKSLDEENLEQVAMRGLISKCVKFKNSI
jgi:hypothetical protein